MSRKFRNMLLCLLLIAALCAVYELWLAPYLAVLSGQPVQERAQAEVSEMSGLTVRAQGAAENNGSEKEAWGDGSAGGGNAEAGNADSTALKKPAPAQISVKQKELGMDENKITYFEVDVQLSDASELKAALAHDKYGQNIKDTLSDIAEEHHAALAVNGDFYGYRSDGIVIRNGVLYRDAPTDRECLVLYRDGTMDVVVENTTSGQELLDAGAWNVLSFGPVLVEDGVAREDLKDTYKVDDLNVSISGPEPRTAIGCLGPNHFLILIVDGRQPGYSRGMDFEELAKVFVEHGCTLAYNLDGGSSVTLYQDGEIINSPCPLVGKERNISDILYVEAVGQ